MQLSPLNFWGVIATEALRQKTPKPQHQKRYAIECWKCPDCDEVYDLKDEAEECCEEDLLSTLHPEEPPSDCPVCGKECLDVRDATNCCLWKDIDAATRYAIADKVEAGATWAESLNIDHIKTPHFNITPA